MRVSYKWLSELVDLPKGFQPEAIAEQLTMAGLEVEGLHQSKINGPVIARITHKEAVAGKSDVFVCQLDVGAPQTRTVVSTVATLEVGMRVVYAPPQSVLSDGKIVEARTLHKTLSEGMLCSERELGLSEEHATVLVLSDEDMQGVNVGDKATTALGLDDVVFEINVTPNRPDALSHMGVARELNASSGARGRFFNPSVKEMSGPIHDALVVHVEAREACPRYAARVLEGIVIKKSPLWLRSRLFACGIRPINNVVDVTNWVLLERGHPLHAFDWDLIAKDRGRAVLNVRQARQGETLHCLDSVERKLTTEDLVVADAHGPVALAGVIGGSSTEIRQSTQSVVLESAYFVPQGIRRTARRHGVSTESSYRFERGTDPNGVLAALDRAAELLVQINDAKVRRELIDIYPQKVDSTEVVVRTARIAQITGYPPEELDEAKIRGRLSALGIETVGKRGDALSYRIPTFRPDLTREIDLIEEIMRLVGLAKVPSVRRYGTKSSVGLFDARLDQTRDKVRQSLLASGFSEAINYSFGSALRYGWFSANQQMIRLDNPLGEELSVMRQSLVPDLVKNVHTNVQKGHKNVRLFEMGKVFLGTNEHGKQPNVTALLGAANFDAWAIEREHVAGVMSGQVGSVSFKDDLRAADFFDLKGVLEHVLSDLHCPVEQLRGQVLFKQADLPFLHPGFSAKVELNCAVGTHVLGYLGRLHPDVLAKMDLDADVFVFELDLEALAGNAPTDRKMQPLPKFPSTSRDLAIVIDEAIAASAVVAVIKDCSLLTPMLVDFKIFDIYQGQGIADGQKSLAFSLTFRSNERTLTDEEVQAGMDQLLLDLKGKLGASLR